MFDPSQFGEVDDTLAPIGSFYLAIDIEGSWK